MEIKKNIDYKKIVDSIVSILNRNGYTIKETQRRKKREVLDPEEVLDVDTMISDERKHIVIIGVFAKAKGIKKWKRSQRDLFVKKNIKQARELTNYKIMQIVNTMAYLHKNANFKWTLGTVGKYIDENLIELDKKERINNKKIVSL